MKYKFISDSVVARIDDDGLSRVSCSVEDAAYLAWLAEGNTPEPADQPPAPTAKDLLEKLDADNALTQRNLRDFIMLTAEAIKLGQPVDLTAIPGVAKVYAVEAEAVALRGQL